MMANPPAGRPTPGWPDHTVEHEQTVGCKQRPVCSPVRLWRDLPWAPVTKPKPSQDDFNAVVIGGTIRAFLEFSPKRGDIFRSIKAERQRQDAKWGWPNEGLAGGNLDKKVSILAEEFGEVAHAVLEGDTDNLRDELIQVAAVCVAWLESEAGWT